MNLPSTQLSKLFSVRNKRRGNFVEQTLATFVRKMEKALFAEEIAGKNGLLQTIDPRVKIIGFLWLIIDATLAKNLFAILFIFATAILLAVFSVIPLRTLATRAWLGVLIFTGTIALPVIFITPGNEIFRLPLIGWMITQQGMMSAAFLISRVETTVTLSLILVLCTSWAHVLKGLRVLGVPIVFVVILAMTYRYIFVILEKAQNMFEARKSRLIGKLGGSENRRLVTANVGVLLTKSVHLNSEIYLAMQSRGFRGEVYTLEDFAMRGRDWLALTFFLLIAVFAFWLGRQNFAEILMIFN